MLFYIKELFQHRKQSSQRPLEQDFHLQSGLEFTSKTVSAQMISSSRRQASINCTRMRPELTFKDLKCLLGMEVDFFFFLNVVQRIWVTLRQERAERHTVHAPLMGKGMESDSREASRTISF